MQERERNHEFVVNGRSTGVARHTAACVSDVTCVRPLPHPSGALSAIREQNKLIAAEVDRHQKAIQGALLQHLSDSNSLIQAIYTGYQQIVSASQSPEDLSRAEKKARPSSDQHP